MKKMEKNKLKNRKNSYTKTKNLYKTLFLIVVCMGLGFAFFSTGLKIEGLASIFNPKYNVYITNTAVTSGSTTPTSAAAIVGDDKMEIDFSTSLPTLTDYYEVSTTLSNKGRNKAYYTGEEIKIFDSNGTEISMPNDIEVKVLNSNGTDVALNHELAAGSDEVLKIKMDYKAGSTLPATQPVYTVKVVFTYALEAINVPASLVTMTSSHTSKTNIQDALDEIAGMLE